MATGGWGKPRGEAEEGDLEIIAGLQIVGR